MITLMIALGEIGAGERLRGFQRRIRLVRRVQIRVAVHVTAAAGRHLEDVHVEAEFRVPGQETVVVVHLHARRPVVFRYERAA